MPLPCTVRFGVEECQGSCPATCLLPSPHRFPSPTMRTRRFARLLVLAAVVAVAIAAVFKPDRRAILIEGTIAGLLGLGMSDLFTLGLERLVGLRYLHRGRRSRGARIALVAGLSLMAVGFGLLALVHARLRGLETVAVIGILVGGLVAVVAFLLRVFSV